MANPMIHEIAENEENTVTNFPQSLFSILLSSSGIGTEDSLAAILINAVNRPLPSLYLDKLTKEIAYHAAKLGYVVQFQPEIKDNNEDTLGLISLSSNENLYDVVNPLGFYSLAYKYVDFKDLNMPNEWKSLHQRFANGKLVEIYARKLNRSRLAEITNISSVAKKLGISRNEFDAYFDNFFNAVLSARFDSSADSIDMCMNLYSEIYSLKSKSIEVDSYDSLKTFYYMHAARDFYGEYFEAAWKELVETEKAYTEMGIKSSKRMFITYEGHKISFDFFTLPDVEDLREKCTTVIDMWRTLKNATDGITYANSFTTIGASFNEDITWKLLYYDNPNLQVVAPEEKTKYIWPDTVKSNRKNIGVFLNNPTITIDEKLYTTNPDNTIERISANIIEWHGYTGMERDRPTILIENSENGYVLRLDFGEDSKYYRAANTSRARLLLQGINKTNFSAKWNFLMDPNPIVCYGVAEINVQTNEGNHTYTINLDVRDNMRIMEKTRLAIKT